MHITVPTDTLRSILESASRIATKHITLPILQCVLLESNKEGTLTITATNLEIGIQGTLHGKVDEVGKVLVPAQTLRETITLITQKEVTLSTDGDLLHIEAESSKTDIKTMDGSDFPTIPHITGTTYTIQSTLFAHGIKTTAFAASQSSIKPELGSIYIFQKKEQSLTFVATDSFRLIEKTIPQKGLVFEGSLLIPFKNALELSRVAEEVNSEVTICVGENQCSLKTDTLYITSRLVAGSFPDYEQIIPKEYTSYATVLVKDVGAALKKTNIFLNKFMQLTCTVSQNTLTLSSQNSDAGATTESIHATIKGDEIRLNFNQRYVSDIIPHITDDSIEMKFAGIGRPMVIQNAHESSLRYLVMPMNK
jgi:DNA polymerase III subunit beta